MKLAIAAAVALLLSTAAPSIADLCPGDCGRDGMVSLADLRAALDVALGIEPLATCTSADADGSGGVTVDDLVRAAAARAGECPRPPSPTPSASGTATPTPTPTNASSEQIPPTDSSLLTWLQEGRYRDWHAESAIHASVGPHFGRVRTYLNDAVFDSLSAHSPAHPAGAALVKELYGFQGEQVNGWSVMVKIQDDSAGGNGWYWFERYNGTTFSAGAGIPLCYGCHGSDFGSLPTRDYVLTPFPLQ